MRRDELTLADSPVYRIPIALIDVPADRLRDLKPEQARAIGEAIDADRQYQPITVAQLPGSERFTLTEGLHRLEGCRLFNLRDIEARIGPADKASRTREEVLSAWARADHDVFDKAAQVMALAKLGHADNRDEQACAIIAQDLRWDLATAEALGISRRSVFNLLTIAKVFGIGHVARLRAIGHADQLVPLLALAKRPPDDIEIILQTLEAASEPMTIAEAIDQMDGRDKATPPEKRLSALLGSASRMQGAERWGAFVALAENHWSDFERAFRQVANSRTGDAG